MRSPATIDWSAIRARAAAWRKRKPFGSSTNAGQACMDRERLLEAFDAYVKENPPLDQVARLVEDRADALGDCMSISEEESFQRDALRTAAAAIRRMMKP